MLEFLVDNIFRGFFFWKDCPRDSRQFNGNKFHVLPLADIFFYSYEAECVMSSSSTGKGGGAVQLHRWCFVYTQPRFWKLPGPDVSCWTRHQRHGREQYFWVFYLRRSTPIDLERRSTSHYHLWQNWRFQSFCFCMAIFHLRPPTAS